MGGENIISIYTRRQIDKQNHLSCRVRVIGYILVTLNPIKSKTPFLDMTLNNQVSWSGFGLRYSVYFSLISSSAMQDNINTRNMYLDILNLPRHTFDISRYIYIHLDLSRYTQILLDITICTKIYLQHLYIPKHSYIYRDIPNYT